MNLHCDTAKKCATVVLVALTVLGMSSGIARAALLAQWTFENFPDPSGTVVPASGIVPENGINAAASVASVNTSGTVNTVAGNGSSNSYSSNGWNVGEGFTFQTVSTGYDRINLTWDQTGSSTGPRDFKVQYSTDGTNFFDILTSPTYTVLLNGTPPPLWNGTTPNPANTYSRDLSTISALNDQAMIFLRLLDNSTTSIDGGTVGSVGTSRVDNVSITAIPISQPWINPLGGSFGTGSNWTGGSPPTADNIAIFDLQSSGYSVTADQDFSVSKLFVGTDVVTFDLGIQTINVVANDFQDLRVADGDGDIGILRLTSGTLKTTGLAVAATNGTSGTTGLLEITGPTAKLEIVGEFDENQIGGDGNDNGEVRISGGGKLLAPDAILSLGRESGAGLLSVSGTQSTVELSELYVGLLGHGELELINNAIMFVDEFMSIANQGGSTTGSVRVSSSAELHVGRRLVIGRGGEGSLIIESGGIVTSKAFPPVSGTIGEDELENGEVLVTGVGSKWLQDGAMDVGRRGSGTLEIQNSGIVQAKDVWLARFSTATSHVAIDGVGSELQILDGLVVGGEFSAAGGTALIEAANGGKIIVGDLLQLWSGGTVDLTGGGSAEVGIVGTPAAAGTLKVGSGGTLAGLGEIKGNVQNASGIVSPGASAGTLKITGSLTQLAGGALNMEIAGPAGTQYDQLNVTGDLSLDGSVNIDFTGAYVPTLGSKFDLFTVGGAFDISSATIQFTNAPSAVSLLQSFSNGIFSIIAGPLLAGDYDLNGSVTNDDYLAWRQQFGSSVSAYVGADGNGDGNVDAADYVVWRKALNASSASVASRANVPEPSSLVMLALVACVGGQRFSLRPRPRSSSRTAAQTFPSNARDSP